MSTSTGAWYASRRVAKVLGVTVAATVAVATALSSPAHAAASEDPQWPYGVVKNAEHKLSDAVSVTIRLSRAAPRNENKLFTECLLSAGKPGATVRGFRITKCGVLSSSGKRTTRLRYVDTSGAYARIAESTRFTFACGYTYRDKTVAAISTAARPTAG